MHARTHRTTSTAHSPRVRPHIRRRNGIVDAPEQSSYERPHVSPMYAWRAFG